jgi:glycosyltransferase involved in cell wall biosynthesis
MKFFIVTPSYNSQKYLPAAVYSVREQASSQIEVHHHVQDGGSTDGTVEFLKEYIARQPATENYQLTFASKADEGMYDALNKGFAYSLQAQDDKPSWALGMGSADDASQITNNPYASVLAWLNCDEQYLPGAFERVAGFLGKHPEHDAVCGSLILVNEKGDPIAARREDIPLRKSYLLYGPLYAMSCTLFFRGNLWYKGLLNINTHYRYVADADLILRMLDRNVLFGYIRDYQALFSVLPGENLSCKAKEESLAMQQAHGRRSSRLFQRVILAAKYIEKLLSGCYRPDDLDYSWLDVEARVHYKAASRVGFRFKGHWDQKD